MKNFDFKKLIKNKWFWIAIVVISIGGMISDSLDDSDNQGNTSKVKTEQASKKQSSKKTIAKSSSKRVVAKSSSKKVEKKKAPVKKTKSSQDKDLTELNNKIAEDLKQDKGWADGTLDPNGNPTQNGTPNQDYAWSKFVDKMTVNNEKQVKVMLNGGIFGLSKAEVAEVLRHCRMSAVAQMTVYNFIKDDEVTHAGYLNAWYGNRAIGRSKLSDYNEFKIYMQ